MNHEEGHIGLRQGTVLIYTVLSTKLFLQYPEFLIEVGGPAGWQVALVMTAAGLLLFLPLAALARRFPGEGLATIGQKVAGSFLGPVVTLAVAAWLLVDTAITVRSFTETFIVAIVPTTPPSVLTTVIVLCMVFASYRGVEPLARATQVLFPLILAGTLVAVILNLPRGDISRLYPLFGHGLTRVVAGGVTYSGMVAEALILLAIGYAFRSPKAFRSSGLISILLFGLTAALVTAVLIMVFGAPDAARQPFPMFQLARLIYLGRFVQRTESIIVMFWVFAAAVRVSASFHAGVVSLTGALGLPYYRPVIFPLAVLVTTLSLVPEDMLVVLRLDRDWMRPLGTGVMLLPLVLLVVAMIRKKGGQTHAA